MDKIIVYVFLFIIWIIVWYLIAKIYFLVKIKKLQKQSVSKSKQVILGQVNEKIAPFLPNFNYNVKDLVFVGKGIDYIVFDGLSNGELKQIVFLEIKTWKSKQNKNERLIEKIVSSKKIKYEIFRI